VRWPTFKTRVFARWARKEGVTNRALLVAVTEMESGLVDARLGGGLFKKRVALPGGGKRGGARTIVAGNFRDRWIFLCGFAKNERENIDQQEERDLKRVGGVLLGVDRTALGRLLEAGEILEVEDG
jgi:hypothetical protein